MTSATTGPAPTSAGPDPHPGRQPSVIQLRVLRLVASGHTNPQIGAILGLTDGQTDRAVAAITRLLGTHHRIHTATAAISAGILPPDSVDAPGEYPLSRAEALQLARLTAGARLHYAVEGLRTPPRLTAVTLPEPGGGTRTLYIGDTTVPHADGTTTVRTAITPGHAAQAPELPASMPQEAPQPAWLTVLAASGDTATHTQIGQRLGRTRAYVGARLSEAYQRLDVTYLPRAERRAAAYQAAIRAGLINAP